VWAGVPSPALPSRAEKLSGEPGSGQEGRSEVGRCKPWLGWAKVQRSSSHGPRWVEVYSGANGRPPAPLGQHLVNNLLKITPLFLGFPHLSPMRSYVDNYLQLLYLWFSLHLPECPSPRTSNPWAAGSNPARRASNLKGLQIISLHPFFILLTYR